MIASHRHHFSLCPTELCPLLLRKYSTARYFCQLKRLCTKWHSLKAMHSGQTLPNLAQKSLIAQSTNFTQTCFDFETRAELGLICCRAKTALFFAHRNAFYFCWGSKKKAQIENKTSRFFFFLVSTWKLEALCKCIFISDGIKAIYFLIYCYLLFVLKLTLQFVLICEIKKCFLKNCADLDYIWVCFYTCIFSTGIFYISIGSRADHVSMLSFGVKFWPRHSFAKFNVHSLNPR